MKVKRNIFLLIFILFLLSLSSSLFANVTPPQSSVKLVFIHHSTGENWLADDNGGLGTALMNNNYFVSDTNYGWGPDSIGDRTDFGNWYEWFRGENSSTYLSSLYNLSNQNASYSRLGSDPGGENKIIMFKSCFPNSNLSGNPNDTPTTGSNPLRSQDAYSEYMTVSNAKGIYVDLLNYFATRQDKLFVVITAPPLRSQDTDATAASNARAFNNWLVNDWLSGYQYKNVAVFDFYNVLTGANNHHRWNNNAVEHAQGDASNMSAYPTEDSHPNQTGNIKATSEFVSLLNYFYNTWGGGGSSPPPTSGSTLTVQKSGNGAGVITCSYGYINCGESCANQSHQYPSSAVVTLTAAHIEGSTFFAGWGGDCGSCWLNSICDVTVTSDKTCTAIFNQNSSMLFYYNLAQGFFQAIRNVLTGQN